VVKKRPLWTQVSAKQLTERFRTKTEKNGKEVKKDANHDEKVGTRVTKASSSTGEHVAMIESLQMIEKSMRKEKNKRERKTTALKKKYEAK
jgi:hypothetical protein